MEVQEYLPLTLHRADHPHPHAINPGQADPACLRRRGRRAGLAKKSEITGETCAAAGEGIELASIPPARKTRRVYTKMLSWLIVLAIG